MAAVAVERKHAGVKRLPQKLGEAYEEHKAAKAEEDAALDAQLKLVREVHLARNQYKAKRLKREEADKKLSDLKYIDVYDASPSDCPSCGCGFPDDAGLLEIAMCSDGCGRAVHNNDECRSVEGWCGKCLAARAPKTQEEWDKYDSAAWVAKAKEAKYSFCINRDSGGPRRFDYECRGVCCCTDRQAERQAASLELRRVAKKKAGHFDR